MPLTSLRSFLKDGKTRSRGFLRKLLSSKRATNASHPTSTPAAAGETDQAISGYDIDTPSATSAEPLRLDSAQPPPATATTYEPPPAPNTIFDKLRPASRTTYKPPSASPPPPPKPRFYSSLKYSLQGLRNNHTWYHGGKPAPKLWPTELQLERLSQGVGGNEALATLIVRFIGDGLPAINPDSQLDTCLEWLEGLEQPNTARHTFRDTLDTFYRFLMSRIPATALPTALRVMGFTIVLSDLSRREGSITFGNSFNFARFLCLDKDGFYHPIRELFPVLSIPHVQSAHRQLPKFRDGDGSYIFLHDDLFSSFLQNPERAGPFYLNLTQAWHDMTILTLRWYSRFIHSSCQYPACELPRENIVFDYSKWTDDPSYGLKRSLSRIREFVYFNCWNFCAHFKSSQKEIIAELRNFNFCHLPSVINTWAEERAFLRFIIWLAESETDDPIASNLIRFKPTSRTDFLLESQISPWDPLPLRNGLPNNLLLRGYDTFSLHRRTPFHGHLDILFMAFWIGEGERTAMIVLTRQAGIDY